MGGNVKFNNSGQNNYTKAQEKIPEGIDPSASIARGRFRW